MPFIRVRFADRNAPRHEFDIPTVKYEAHPERYKVVDPEPVWDPRPPVHIAKRRTRKR
jgi:hypothetical protein